MRGFLAGALTLIVLETLGRQGASKRTAGLLQTLGDGLRRVLSPQVAGLRNFAGGPLGTSSSRAGEPTTAVPGRPPRTGRQVARPGHPVAQ